MKKAGGITTKMSRIVLMEKYIDSWLFWNEGGIIFMNKNTLYMFGKWKWQDIAMFQCTCYG